MLIFPVLICACVGNAAYAEDAFAFTVLPEDKDVLDDEGTAVFKVEVIDTWNSTSKLIEKSVLIYHTHNYEAYEQDPQNPYVQTEKWRTKDNAHNVTAVGKALAAALRAKGMYVVHDTTAFEPPSIDQAYDRSLKMLEERQSTGEVYDLYIDLHRDALASDAEIRKTVNISGEEVARFMVLVGKGTTGGYTEKPDWEQNYALAVRITDELNRQQENLARNVKIKTGRFNQHIADCCLLIECGMNTNTLQEVIAGVPYLAEAIAAALCE